MNAIDRSGCTAAKHGDETAYSKNGCRCTDAREDTRIRAKRRRHGTYEYLYIDPTGTKRRLQALMALGHNANTIAAAEPALSAHMVRYLRSEKPGTPQRRVHRRLAAAVARAYAALSMTPGMDTRSRRQAETLGYRPPLAWDDDTIDDPAARPVTALPRKRDGLLAEAGWLMSWGVSREEAARRLGVKEASIRRGLERQLQKRRAS